MARTTFNKTVRFAKKSQAGSEYILILMVLIGIAAYFIGKGFEENELTLAVATTRTAGEEIALRENTVLKNATYTMTGDTIVLKPLFGDNALNDPASRGAIRQEVLQKVRMVIAPNSPPPASNCFTASRVYCVE